MSRPVLRCALYTRKSSEDGLEQAFNSLDAQREACAAYVKSQASEGWKALPAQYDDGGFSGGSMERPGLQHLLADIAAGKIDVVVVYKIDRLTRALADFARMLELFDRHSVSFVSVTQAFNTTTSMGRLTLNVLLSFAQFEREVTGERIRDKIAASKARGLWMGGTLPLGYDGPAPDAERVLVINPVEAEVVRAIFRRYLDVGSVTELLEALRADGVVSKRQPRRDGRVSGGDPFSRGALFYLLRNRTYRGEIVHRDRTYPGRHEAIVDAELFDAVQARLMTRSRRSRRSSSKSGVDASATPGSSDAWLTGRIVDAVGEGMSPTTSRGRGGTRFRYYVSRSLQQGRVKRGAGQGAGQRIAAPMIEARVAAILHRLGVPRATDHWPGLIRVELGRGHIALLLEADEPDALRPLLTDTEVLTDEGCGKGRIRLVHPVTLHRRGHRSVLSSSTERPRPDPALIAGLRAAHACLHLDRTGLPAADGSPEKPYARRRMRLAFLAPDIQQAILVGRQPPGLTLARLMIADIPLDWDKQRAMIANLAAG